MKTSNFDGEREATNESATDTWYPCCHCEGSGIIEDAEHGDCECSACDGTGEAGEEE
jgi:hypothetical protein